MTPHSVSTENVRELENGPIKIREKSQNLKKVREFLKILTSVQVANEVSLIFIGLLCCIGR